SCVPEVGTREVLAAEIPVVQVISYKPNSLQVPLLIAGGGVELLLSEAEGSRILKARAANDGARQVSASYGSACEAGIGKVLVREIPCTDVVAIQPNAR